MLMFFLLNSHIVDTNLPNQYQAWGVLLVGIDISNMRHGRIQYTNGVSRSNATLKCGLVLSFASLMIGDPQFV